MRHNAKKDDAALPGYGDYSFKEDETYSGVTLVLPNRLRQALTEERLAAEALKAQEDEDLRQRKAVDESSLPTGYKPRPALGSSEIDPNREKRELEEAAADSARAVETGELIAVHDVLEPLKLVKDLKTRTPDKEIHKRNELLYKQLKTKGHYRALAQLPSFLPIEDMLLANEVVEASSGHSGSNRVALADRLVTIRCTLSN